MIIINWWVIAVLGIWLFATIGAAATKDSDCLWLALIATVFAGIFYLLVHMKE